MNPALGACGCLIHLPTAAGPVNESSSPCASALNGFAPAKGHGEKVEPSAGSVTETPVLGPKQLSVPLPS